MPSCLVQSRDIFFPLFFFVGRHFGTTDPLTLIQPLVKSHLSYAWSIQGGSMSGYIKQGVSISCPLWNGCSVEAPWGSMSSTESLWSFITLLSHHKDMCLTEPIPDFSSCPSNSDCFFLHRINEITPIYIWQSMCFSVSCYPHGPGMFLVFTRLLRLPKACCGYEEGSR